jgi:hypothetical protein
MRLLAFDSRREAMAFIQACGGVLVEKEVPAPPPAPAVAAGAPGAVETPASGAPAEGDEAGADDAGGGVRVKRARKEDGGPEGAEGGGGGGAAAPAAGMVREWHVDCKASEIVMVRETTVEEEEASMSGLSVLDQLRMAISGGAP